MLSAILVSSVVVFIIMLLLWLIQLRTKKADIVDIAWSYNFAIIALINYFLSEGAGPRKLLISAMVCIWSIRLGTHLYVRVMAHKEEEARYQELRKEWKGQEGWKFFIFYMFQGILNVILSLPVFLICANVTPRIHWLEYMGVIIWLMGVIGESTADRQLQLFKNNPTNKGKVCQDGLWNYSRHPNYFFEWTIWMAYFIFSLASPWGWLAAICPALMLYFLLKVTGIPMTEEQSIRSKGEAYREYQRTTSKFVPWIKRKNTI